MSPSLEVICTVTQMCLSVYYLRHGEGYVFIAVRFTSAMAKVMFSSLSVAFSVCLSVCLSVSNITGKRLNGCSWIFQGNIFRMFHLILWTQAFFALFRRNPRLLTALGKKRLNGFSWNFQNKTDLTQGTIWNTFGILRLTPWILRRFIYFLDLCLFVILWKNGWMDFHEIFMKRQTR